MSIYNDLKMFNFKKVCVCVCITVRSHHSPAQNPLLTFHLTQRKARLLQGLGGTWSLSLLASSPTVLWSAAVASGNSHSQPWPFLSQCEALFSKIPTRFILSFPQIFAQKSFPWAPQPPPYLKLFSLASPILPYFIFRHSTYYHQRNDIMYTFPFSIMCNTYNMFSIAHYC